MKFIKDWLKRRAAVEEARTILKTCNEGRLLSLAQQEELLALRKIFWREKMGSWLERMTLYRVAASLRPDATVVEIGSWVGVSTCYIGCGLRSGSGGQITAVDTFLGSTIDEQAYKAWKKSVDQMGGTTLSRFREHVAQLRLSSCVAPLPGVSVEVASQWDGGPIDFLYIDGDHVYESVCADFEAWFPHVAKDAVIAFHDYDERHPGVSRLVNEVLAGPLYGCKTFQADALLVVWCSRGEISQGA